MSRTLPVVLDTIVTAVEPALSKARYSVRLLVGRHVWLVLVADLAILIYAYLIAADGSPQGIDSRIFRMTAIVPFFVLQLPILSRLVAVDREPGALDLALGLASPAWLYVQRAAPIVLFFGLQSSLVALTMSAPLDSRLAALSYAWVVNLLVTSLSMFWALRLRSAGAVVVASGFCCAFLSPWLSFDPLRRAAFGDERFLGIPMQGLRWLGTCFVLLAAVAILSALARRRLNRPESIL